MTVGAIRLAAPTLPDTRELVTDRPVSGPLELAPETCRVLGFHRID